MQEGEDLGDALRQAVTLLRDEREAGRWAGRCIAWAGNFTWDRTAARLLDVGLSELRRRRNGRRERRRRSDLVTWSELRVADAADFGQRAVTSLRPEDLWRQEGDRAWLLCHACDELDVRAVGERLGGHVLSAGVATNAQLLGDLSSGSSRARAGGQPDAVPGRTW